MLRQLLFLALFLPLLTQSKPVNTCSYVQGVLVCDDDDYDYGYDPVLGGSGYDPVLGGYSGGTILSGRPTTVIHGNRPTHTVIHDNRPKTSCRYVNGIRTCTTYYGSSIVGKK